MPPKLKINLWGAPKSSAQQLQDESSGSEKDVQVVTPGSITPVYKTRATTRQQHQSPQSDKGKELTTDSSLDLSFDESTEERPQAKDTAN